MKIICCSTPLYLGCFETCEDINTGILATSTGNYTIKWNFKGVIKDIVVAAVSGVEITIPGEQNIFNEANLNKIEIYNEASVGITVVDGGVTYDRFSFNMAVKY